MSLPAELRHFVTQLKSLLMKLCRSIPKPMRLLIQFRRSVVKLMG